MIGNVPGRPDLPRAEVNAIRAENLVRLNMGVPVLRQSYDKPSPMTITPSGVLAPKTLEDFLQ